MGALDFLKSRLPSNALLFASSHPFTWRYAFNLYESLRALFSRKQRDGGHWSHTSGYPIFFVGHAIAPLNECIHFVNKGKCKQSQ